MTNGQNNRWENPTWTLGFVKNAHWIWWKWTLNHSPSSTLLKKLKIIHKKNTQYMVYFGSWLQSLHQPAHCLVIIFNTILFLRRPLNNLLRCNAQFTVSQVMTTARPRHTLTSSVEKVYGAANDHQNMQHMATSADVSCRHVASRMQEFLNGISFSLCFSAHYCDQCLVSAKSLR